MNYLPFVGFWFIGAGDQAEQNAYFCSWGLLAVIPVTGLVVAKLALNYYRRIRTI